MFIISSPRNGEPSCFVGMWEVSQWHISLLGNIVHENPPGERGTKDNLIFQECADLVFEPHNPVRHSFEINIRWPPWTLSKCLQHRETQLLLDSLTNQQAKDERCARFLALLYTWKLVEHGLQALTRRTLKHVPTPLCRAPHFSSSDHLK